MDLSEKEITLLSAILGRIAGRGCYLEQLANELDKLGVEHYPNHCLDGSADLTIPNNWGEGLEDQA